jgi:hypothetical protein
MLELYIKVFTTESLALQGVEEVRSITSPLLRDRS